MPKYKKTKQQKIIKDLRRKLLYNTPSSKTPEEKAETVSLPQVNEKTIALQNYNLSTSNIPKVTDSKSNNPYLIHDLKKTGILTGTIILAQIVLLFLLKYHILVLPIAKY